MASASEYVQPLRAALVPIAGVPQAGVCRICHSSVSSGGTVCPGCSRAVDAGFDPPEILPITMSLAGGLIHGHLRGYKDSESEAARERMTMRLAALLAIFVKKHDECLGPWDVATCVPSMDRVAMSPIVSKIRAFEGRYDQLLTALPDSRERTLSRSSFGADSAASGQRVSLLDDSFVSGAKVFSAVSALREAGTEVVGPLVIGRHVHASYEPTGALLSWLGEREWNDNRCCRCGGEFPGAGNLF